MKKLAMGISIVGALVASSTMFASAAPVMQAAPSFTGFYAGADVGFRSLQIRQNDSNRSLFLDNTSTNDSTETQPTEGLHIGYGYQFNNNVYLGAKAFAQIAQGNTDSSATYATSTGVNRTAHTNFNYNNVYGINAQLGYVLTPNFLPYITAGYQALYLHYSDDGGFTTDPSHYAYSINKYLNGWDAGLGMHYKVTNHVLLNAEFTGAWYGSVKATAADGYTSKITTYAYTGLVGFSYLF